MKLEGLDGGGEVSQLHQSFLVRDLLFPECLHQPVALLKQRIALLIKANDRPNVLFSISIFKVFRKLRQDWRKPKKKKEKKRKSF